MAELEHAHDNMRADRLAKALEQLEQELAVGRTRVTKQRAQYQAALHEAKLTRASASDWAWDLADVEQRLRDLNEQREGPGDPLMEREIAHLTGRRAELEERVLAQLLLVDELMARTHIEEQALAAAERDWARREAILIAERDRLEQEQHTQAA